MNEIDELEKTCCLEKSVGPCVENLDKELGVERQHTTENILLATT